MPIWLRQKNRPGHSSRLTRRLDMEALEERALPSLFGPAVPVLANSGFVTGDFTGDGKDQLATVDLQAGTNQLKILEFVGGAIQTFHSQPTALTQVVAAADVTGNGKLDLIGDAPTGLVVLLGNGAGAFGPPINTGLGPIAGVYGNPGPVALGDFNGDGKLDLASVADGVALGNGDGTFQAIQGPDLGAAIVAGDFNGDGKLDLAYTSFVGPLKVLLGNGDGTFRTAGTYDVGAEPVDLQVGDFRNDGKLDIVIADQFGSGVSVLLGNGDGTFAAAQSFPIGPNVINSPFASALGDFNGDGKLDIAVTFNGSSQNGNVAVLLGNGDGTFATAQTFPAGKSATEIRAGNFVGDGRLDLAVLENSFGPTPPEQIAILPNTNGITQTATPNQLYVQQLYLDLLHRQADASGLAFFSGLLDQGTVRGQIVLSIEHSPEYRTDQVEALYASVLNRQADPSGLQSFVTYMEAGHSLEDAEAIILGSPEYYALAGGTANDYLNSLYNTVLGRGIDPTGQAGFGALMERGFSTSTVAFFVLHSAEARQDLVNGFYVQFLDRNADPSGLAAFTAPRPGGFSDDFILAAILSSDEFFANAQALR